MTAKSVIIKFYCVFNYFASARGAKYCDQRVCMSVCLSADMS